MPEHNRFYRFSEFGRELLYDTQGTTAFFISEVENHLLDLLQEGKSLDECIAGMNHVYTDDVITRAVQKITDECLSKPRTHQEISPFYTLDLNIIQKCNLRCKYCYSKVSGISPAMSKKTACKAVDFITEFHDCKQLSISFYGGEPLLNFQVIKSSMEHASKKAEEKGYPVQFNITTNGTLLTDDIITFFAQYKTNIEISIDGPASIHDAMRITPDKEGTHNLIMDRLDKVLRTPGFHTISVSSVVTNHSRLRDVYRYLYQFPFRNINISCVRPLYNKENRYPLSDHQKVQYLEDMREIALECLDLLLKGIRPSYYLFERKILQLWNHATNEYYCPAGITRFGVSPQGDVYPCGLAADRDMWKLGTLGRLDKTKVSAWHAHITSQPDECSACWSFNLCVEKCPLQPRNEFQCRVSQHSTRLAIALYAVVKEKNEIMLASLVDAEFLSKIRKMIHRP
ncbi:MAG: 4Fe-4S cluster-binding domain-containing protein [Theionarchaea archaeon]|nr:4Fe-4S cluster-binding domain-containing protein [Theionarchaea archaeon]